jgi:hypothetical protein
MPILGKLAIAAALEFCAWGVARRDLAPRAYVITPLNSNAITLTYSYYTGGLQCDGALIWSPYSLYSGFRFRFQDSLQDQLAVRIPNRRGDRCLMRIQPNILGVIHEGAPCR